jgi:cytochrome c-type biogenesis protein CcmH/NrfG
MPETLRCPSCGAANDTSATTCARCNFPLLEQGTSAPAPATTSASTEAAEPGTAAEPGAKGQAPFTFDPGPRPVRRRRERPGTMQPIQVQLWLVTGAAVVLGIVYFAAQGFWRSNVPPVAGAKPEQQQRADLARRLIEKDSTNVEARIELGNVLYDTGNWSEAIVHYRSADRLDPTRPTTVVDLGVCYYNLGRFATAESLFHRALALDPQQVFALFNLGIVAESRAQWDAALDFYHRAMRASPPEAMKPALEQHMQTVMAKTGKKAPPLP